MRLRSLLLIPALAVAGCSPDDQPHPFEAVPEIITRTIGSEGGIISTPAGAAIRIPTGALQSSTSFTLESGVDVTADGRAVSRSGFRLSPQGLVFTIPATAELQVQRTQADSLWLASIVRVTPDGVTEHPLTRVDVALGIASTRLQGTGALTAVVPPAAAVIPVSSTIPAPPPQGPPTPSEIAALLAIDSLSVNCGAPGRRCDGVILAASPNLLSRVGRAAMVYPQLKGVLRRVGPEVTGNVEVRGGFRIELARGATAENVVLDESFSIRASLVPSGFFPEMGVAGAAESSISFVPPRDGEPARLIITREVQVPDESGVLEAAQIYISFPLQIHS